MYERKHGRLFQPSDEKFLRDVVVGEASPPTSTPVRRNIPTNVYETPQKPAALYSYTQLSPEGGVIAQGFGDFYRFEFSSNSFIPVCENIKIEIVKSEIEQFLFYLRISDNSELDTARLCQHIVQDMNPCFQADQNAFLWVWLESGTPTASFSVQFSKKEEFAEFQQVFSHSNCLDIRRVHV